MIRLALADLEPASMNELTERASRDKSQMTRNIQSLESKGIVARSTSPQDARVSMVSLTPKGHEVVDSLRQVLAETIDEKLEPLSTGEKRTLHHLLHEAMTKAP